jgi:threonine synthase
VSTRGDAPVLGFDDVLLEGLAVDGGLYVPERWPTLEGDIDTAATYAEVAARVIAPFVEGSVVADGLGELTAATYGRFRHPEVAPVRSFGGGLHLLELFWGPTLSFKDYALQLLGGLFERVLAERGTSILVLGATSGDTGSAAIEALAGRAGVEVVILYPHGRVSEVQRRQMTTVAAPNVRAVAVDGTFDDCQDMVKAAFGDEPLRRRLSLAAVNSINWGRVMAQAAYYAWASARIGGEFDVGVPTGNFGNVLAADVARRMGVPVARLIVANNANHTVAGMLETGRIEPTAVVSTSAPAMDIQVPSNLERLLFELAGRDGAAVAATMRRLRRNGGVVLDEMTLSSMRATMAGAWFDDDAIEDVIDRVHREHGVLLDPHSATGWGAAERLRRPERPVLAVATAHPAKFPEAVAAAVGFPPELPPDLADLADRPERTSRIGADFGELARLLESVPGSV